MIILFILFEVIYSIIFNFKWSSFVPTTFIYFCCTKYRVAMLTPIMLLIKTRVCNSVALVAYVTKYSLVPVSIVPRKFLVQRLNKGTKIIFKFRITMTGYLHFYLYIPYHITNQDHKIVIPLLMNNCFSPFLILAT